MKSPNPMNRKGFTLIELLIVVVIIGILAAIAIPRFSQTRERAFLSSMQSDLRNLQTIQEQWYAEPDNEYTYGGQAIITDNVWSPSDAVTVTISNNTANGWEAEATHEGLPGTTCNVYVGDRADEADEASGAIVCEGDAAPDE